MIRAVKKGTNTKHMGAFMVRAIRSTKKLISLSKAWAHKIRGICGKSIVWLVAWLTMSPIIASLWGGIIIASYQTLMWLRHGHWPQLTALDGLQYLAQFCGSQDAWFWLWYPRNWIDLHILIERTPLFVFLLFSVFPLVILAGVLYWVLLLLGPISSGIELLRIGPHQRDYKTAVGLVLFIVRAVMVGVFTFVDLLIICVISHMWMSTR